MYLHLFIHKGFERNSPNYEKISTNVMVGKTLLFKIPNDGHVL